MIPGRRVPTSRNRMDTGALSVRVTHEMCEGSRTKNAVRSPYVTDLGKVIRLLPASTSVANYTTSSPTVRR